MTTGMALRTIELRRCPRCALPVAPRVRHDTTVCGAVAEAGSLYADGWTPIATVAERDREADWWPETRRAPVVTATIGGFGPVAEHGVPGVWVRGGSRPAVEVHAAAEILARRDRIGRRAALVRALELDADAVARTLKVDEVVLHPQRHECADHRLVFRRGELVALDHRTDAGDCVRLLSCWRHGPPPSTTIDFVHGKPPHYARIHDPAPQLSKLRRMIATAAAARLHSAIADPGLAWLHVRLEVDVVEADGAPLVEWTPARPVLGLRPDWLWRVGRFGLALAGRAAILDADALRNGFRRALVSGPLDADVVPVLDTGARAEVPAR